MSRYDDDYDAPDESEDTDAVVRALRLEIVRMEAKLDQLQADVRERAEEAAEIRARLAELESAIELLQARRRRDEKLLVVAWILVALSLSATLFAYFAA